MTPFLLPLFKSFLFCFQATAVSVLSPDYTHHFKCLPLPPPLLYSVLIPSRYLFFLLFLLLKDFRYKHSTTESVMRNPAKNVCTGFSKTVLFGKPQNFIPPQSTEQHLLLTCSIELISWYLTHLNRLASQISFSVLLSRVTSTGWSVFQLPQSLITQLAIKTQADPP